MAKRHANTKDGIRRLNTKVYDGNGHFSVQLYDTVVYDETRDRLVLDTGGWATPTTVSRMNQAIDHREIGGGVFIKNRVAFYYSHWLGDSQAGYKHGGVQPFVGGKLVLDLKALKQAQETNELLKANAQLAKGIPCSNMREFDAI